MEDRIIPYNKLIELERRDDLLNQILPHIFNLINAEERYPYKKFPDECLGIIRYLKNILEPA